MLTDNLREGYTTGSCAAGAALASALWFKEGRYPDCVEITTPIGRKLVLDIEAFEDGWCGVVKDAGDAPDVTDGCMVKAKVQVAETKGPVIFIAGPGVGTVTQPGLKLPVGEAAINPVPRVMIERAIRPIIGELGATITVSIPGGEKLAQKTFHDRVGVVGGLSVLGTTGIVRPMSEDAVRDSLVLEMNVRICQDKRDLVFVTGMSGERTVLDKYGQHLCCIHVSNYMGFMLDQAQKSGVRTILIAGFAGKLVKLAADIMNTHSHVADGRRETLCTFTALAGAPQDVIQEIYDCRTVQGAIEVIEEYGYGRIWNAIAETAAEKCRLRTHRAIRIGVILLDKNQNVLGESQNAHRILQWLNQQTEL